MKTATLKALPQLLRVDDYAVYRVENGVLSVPFVWGLERQRSAHPDVWKPAEFIDDYTALFNGVPRPVQRDVIDRLLLKLRRDNYAVLSCPPGFGKTFTALYAAAAIGARRVIVLTHRTILVHQWATAIAHHLPYMRVAIFDRRFETIDTKEPALIIASPQRLERATDLKRFRVDLAVADEIHQLITPIQCRGLLKIEPRFLLGLSATPYRLDQLAPVLTWFFGESFIEHAAEKRHAVLTVRTGFIPGYVKKLRDGRLDWAYVMDRQAVCEKRNALIVDCLTAAPQLKWLVLCKRVQHVRILTDLLKERRVDVDWLCGSKKTWRPRCAVLIGTVPKIGTGFDRPDLTGLCLAADAVAYYEQLLGRLRASAAVVLELVDAFAPLKKHWQARQRVYVTVGCRVWDPVDADQGPAVVAEAASRVLT